MRTIAGDDADRFAQISGDLNPIHLNAEFVAATPFGRRVGGSNPLTPTTQTHKKTGACAGFFMAEDRQVSCAGAEAIHRARSSLNTTAMVFAMICRSSRSDQFRR